MDSEKSNVLSEKIFNGIISFFEFLQKFNQVIKDEKIAYSKQNNSIELSYTFRKFNLECYIIDKKYFDEFCLAFNINELSKILNPLNEQNKNKCREKLKKTLEEKKFNLDGKKIIIYSGEEILKKIVKNFSNFSFLNKELLINCMNVPEENLKEKGLLLSKNENNTSLLNIYENFLMTINVPNIIKKEEKKKVIHKNIYYVSEITKKIFLLLLNKDQMLNQKKKKKINDPYNFKNYYLINKDWLEDYKSYFLYNDIIQKLEKTDKDFKKKYSYKRIKAELDDIVKNKIGQIPIQGDSQIPDKLRDSSVILTKIKMNDLNKINEEKDLDLETPEEGGDIDLSYYTPYEFEIINEDIYELLRKEEFIENFDEKIEKQICYQILFGNNQLIIKNKANKKFAEKDVYSNELLIYTENGEIQDDKKSNKINDDFTLEYILSFEKKINFYKELEIILKNSLKDYLIIKKIKFIEKSKENIIDENKNIIGKIINININKDIMEFVKKRLENNIIGNNNNINNVYIENEIIDDNIIIEEQININNSEIMINKINLDERYSRNEESNIEISNNIINDKVENSISNQKEIYEIVNIDNDEKKNKEIKPKEKKNYSNEELKKRILKILDNGFKRNIANNNEQNDLDINVLDSETLDKYTGTNLIEIILMNEESYKNYIQLFDLIYKYNDIKGKDNEIKKKKNIYIENNKKELNDIINCFKGNKLIISDNIKLIHDYQTCLENINNKKKFFLFNKINILDKEQTSIYFFQYKTKHYVYFKESKKILSVKKGKAEQNNLYELEEYKTKKNINEYLDSIKLLSNNNKKDDIKLQKKIINEYYLINDDWINSSKKFDENKNIDEYESFKPLYKSIEGENYKYPVNFSIINKYENESIIENIKVHFNIKNDDLIIYKLFIIKKKQTFICIIDKSIIYFYLLDHGKYNISFLIKYINEEIMNKEISEKLSKKELSSYINFSISDIINNKKEKIINSNFEIIGSFINIEKNKENPKYFIHYYPKISINVEIDIKIKPMLACFANINELRNFYHENLKIKKDNNEDFHQNGLLSNFLKIIRNMWAYYDKKEEEEDICIFISELEYLSTKIQKENIFDSIKLLIEFFVMEIHKQLYKLIFKQEFNFKNNLYSKEKLERKYNKNRTIIRDLFFIEFEISQKCKNNHEIKSYCMNYFLDFELNNDNKNNNQKIIDIIDLFDSLNIDSVCENCEQNIVISKKFISLPKYLIVNINGNNKYNKAILKNTIDIKNYTNFNNKECKYDLMSFIDKDFIAFCKSPINEQWYSYKDAGKKIISEEINKERDVPLLIIYKQQNN